MTAPNNPNIARVTFQYHHGSRVFENTFHLYRSSGWSFTDLVNSLNQAKSLWENFWKPCVPNTVALFNIHGQVYDPLGSPWVADVPISPEELGTRAGVMEASNVTMAVSERANLAGRAYRGRIYVPGLIENDVASDDTVGGALLALLVTFAVNWLSTFSSPATNGALVLFHRNDNLFSTVTAIVLEKVVDSMRRRLPGRGI